MSRRRLWIGVIVGLPVVVLGIVGLGRRDGPGSPGATSMAVAPVEAEVAPVDVEDCAEWSAPAPTEPLAWRPIGDVVEVTVCRVDDHGGPILRGSFGAATAAMLVEILDQRPIVVAAPGEDPACPAVESSFDDRLAFRQPSGALVIVVARYDGCATAAARDHGARYLTSTPAARLELRATIGALPLRVG